MTVDARRLACADQGSGELGTDLPPCIGKSLHCAQGHAIGRIIDLLLDSENRTVLFCIVSFGSVTHFGDDCRVVPFDTIVLDPANDCARVNLSDETLRDAPIYLHGHAAMDDQWWQRVETYYHACQP